MRKVAGHDWGFWVAALFPVVGLAFTNHQRNGGVQAEPAYCQNLARDFCPKIPDLRLASDRTADFSREMKSHLFEVKQSEPYKKFYEHLHRSLKFKGFPIKVTSKQLGEIYKGVLDRGQSNLSDEDLKKIIHSETTACEESAPVTGKSLDSVRREIATAARYFLPSELNFAVLSPDENETEVTRELRTELLLSPQGIRLTSALGNLQQGDDSNKEFGEAYGAFTQFYAERRLDLSNQYRKTLQSQAPAFAKHVLLCEIFFEFPEGVPSEEVAECDVSQYLGLDNVEGILVPYFSDRKSFEESGKQWSDRAWALYIAHRRGQRASLPKGLSEVFAEIDYRGAETREQFDSLLQDYAVKGPAAQKSQEQLHHFLDDSGADSAKLRYMCAKRDEVYRRGLQDEYFRVQRVVDRSEPVVKSIKAVAFPAEDDASKESVARMKKFMEDRMKKLLTHVKDKQTVDQVNRAVAGAKFYDPSQVKDAFSVDEATGLRTIDFGKIPRMDYFYNMFHDPALGELSVMNSYLQDLYLTHKLKDPSGTVMISPAFAQSYRDNPGSMLFMFAHEMGHLVDPSYFKETGIAFPASFQGILKCLAEKKSMGMEPHQHGECFADWFATETVALTLQSMPKENRFAFVQDSMRFMCEFSLGGVGGGSYGANGTDVHPTPVKRINGILGAHPQVREALGCKAKGPQPYCALESEAE